MYRLLLLFAFAGISCSAQPQRLEAPTEPEPVATSDSEAPNQTGLEPVLMDSLRVNGRVVFHDELIETGDALALRLKDLGPFTPVHAGPKPYTSLVNEWAQIAGGEYVKDGRCSDPPSPSLALQSIHRDAVGAETSIECKETCVLTVILRDSEAKANGRDYFERVRSKWTIELTGDTTSWASQVSQADFIETPFEAPTSSGLFGIKTGPDITVRDVELDAAWDGAFDKNVFQAANQEFEVCEGNAKTWRDWWMIRHVIEVDEGGRVSRCENPLPDHLPKSTFACQCAALKSRVDFGPGPVRRVSAYLDYSAKSSHPFGSIEIGKKRDLFHRSAYLTDFDGSDPYSKSLGTNALSHSALKPCAQKLGEMEEKVPVDFVVDAQGAVMEVKALWPDTLKEFGTCAEPILMKASFSCPTAATTLTGHMVITVEPIRR